MNNGITLPIRIDLLTWAAQIRNDLPEYNIPILCDLNKWKAWARFLLMTNNSLIVPNPGNYDGEDGMRKWAIYFVDSNN